MADGGAAYRIAPLTGDPGGLPLVVEAAGRPDVSGLCDYLRERPDWVREQLTSHGAILFRGFDVTGPVEFERVARSVDDDLKNEYLGTSPRDSLSDFVFSASELPSYYPIPQHCEMSFTANPPRRVFFCCFTPPANGGETPLADFRKVWRDLDPGVRKRFEDGGIRIVRNYSGAGGGSRFDFWKLKRWDEMFQTTDRAAVEAKCAEQGFEAIWTGAGDGLRIVSTQPVARDHPVTGERVWHNHVTNFHLGTAPAEYRRIRELRPGARMAAFEMLARLLVAVQRRTRSSNELSMHCTYVNGDEIPERDMDAVRDAVWKNLVVYPWRRGDVVAIDNHSVSHGRLPYRGRREIAVCWA